MKKYLDGAGLKNVLQRIKGKLDLKAEKSQLDLKADKDELAIQSNPNLLDNWYFVNPINQRGQTEYATKSSYTIDRWMLHGYDNTSIKLEEGGIVLNGIDWGQRIENTRLLEGEYTASVLTSEGKLGSITALFSGSEIIATGGPLGDTGVTLNIIYHWFDAEPGISLFALQASNPVKIIAVKLELSDHQTLAHKEGDTWALNDPPPDPALELAKCQRYFYKWSGSRHSSVFHGSSKQYVFIPFPETMRANPIITDVVTQSDWAELEFLTSFKTGVIFVANQIERSGVIARFYADANI